MAGFNSISGLNSGLDTPGIIDAIMAVERRNTEFIELRSYQKQTEISALQALQAKFFALGSQLSQLKRKATFETGTVNVSDTNVMTAKSTGRVPTGTYDLQVLQLARNHQIASQGIDNASDSIFGTGEIRIQVGDGSEQIITIDETNNSLTGIKKAINDAGINVRATIVNDGSSADPNRLVLTGNNTGAKNKISITSSLTGGENLNYSTATFGQPESITSDTGTTSNVSLGASASFSGNQNKIYTFTVQGNGEQTIGSDTITIKWSDGINPEQSILVTQSDTEVELVGAGSEGLKITFSAGTLNAGDTFEIATFAPLLQQASDAKIAIGSTGGNGSPITVTSETNSFTGVIGGVNLTAISTTEPGSSITVSTDVDVDGAKTKIQGFINAYNEIMKYVDDQNKYVEGENTNPLFGDFTVWSMQNSLRRRTSSPVNGLDSKYNQLATIGIRTNQKGQLEIRNASKLESALRENLDDVINLFTDSGNESTAGIEFISASVETKAGIEFDVDITQPPTHGGYIGSSIADPGTTPLTFDQTNNRLKIKVDGLVSDEISIAAKEYNSITELIDELQMRINNDSKIGANGVEVKWNDNGDGTGQIEFVSSLYGETSKIEMVTSIQNFAYEKLGLLSGKQIIGKNVEGTINGETATGSGVILVGDEGNETTARLRLKITLGADDIVDGAEGTIFVTKGVATQVDEFVKSLTAAKDGLFDRRIAGYNAQVDYFKKRIEENDVILSKRRESLVQQYYDMELALGRLQSEASFLTSQLNNINMNWKFNQ